MLTLSEIMTRAVVTLTPETSLREAVELFAVHHISGAPVLRGNAVVGVMSAADVLAFAASATEDPAGDPGPVDSGDGCRSTDDDAAERENVPPGSYFTDLWEDAGADAADRMDPTHGATWRLLEEHTVDEVMTRGAVALRPGDSVMDAADVMQSQSIHRVIVVEDDRLVGIVSALDVARAVAQRRIAARA